MDGLLIVKAGKQELEQVLANGCEGALRRQIRAVDVIHPAADFIRRQDAFGDFSEVLIHGVNELGPLGKKVNAARETHGFQMKKIE